MPIDPSVTYLPIASIAPDTLRLCITVFCQGVGVLCGVVLSNIVAAAWRG